MLSSNAENRTGDPVDEEECVRDDGRDLFQLWQVSGDNCFAVAGQWGHLLCCGRSVGSPVHV